MNGANPQVRQERDQVSVAVVYAGAAVLAFVLIAGSFLTWLVARHSVVGAGLRREGAPVTVLPREINMVDQTLFSAHLASRGDWDAKRRALNSYAWIDRDRKIAAIPIDRAMQLLLERGRVE
jgi:hypothetical protein